MRHRRRKKNQGKTVILTVALLVIAVGVGAYFVFAGQKEPWPEIEEPLRNPLTGEVVTELPSRPFILSTDNDVGAARPQSGLSKADIVYEMPAEGGASRLEPIYYSKIPDKIGPARSARPYFIDLAREYHAVFVHHGWSPQAKTYLERNVVPYISAFTYTQIFYRSTDRLAPHNSYTTGEEVWKIIKKKGWDKKQEVRKFQFLKTTEKQTGEAATDIHIDYLVTKNNYQYDAETGLYKRWVNETLYTDKETGEQITTSNILVQKVKSKEGWGKGRLKIDMTAGGEAMLFTNGTVRKGRWSRENLKSPTIFKDESGKEFKLNQGTSWVQVIDQSGKVSYK